MDKVREEFEKFYSKQNQYGEAHKQELWEVWVASRESVVVKLPEKQDEKVCLFDFQRAYVQGYNHGVDACAKQLDKEGIKYDF